MNKLSWVEIVYIIIIAAAIGTLLKDLFAVFLNGKLIVKGEDGKGYPIFWIVMFFFWILFLFLSVRNYMDSKNYPFSSNNDIKIILMCICWIWITVLNFRRTLRGSEIREKGIYKNGAFYKWRRIREYYWVSLNTIRFEINSLFKFRRKIEITIKDESKLKADEISNMLMHKLYKGLVKK